MAPCWETADQLVKRMFVDPVTAEENLKTAALEYAKAIAAKYPDKLKKSRLITSWALK
jgi:hypothetical protein